MKEHDEKNLARVEGQPLSGSAELPQRPTEDVPPTAPERTWDPWNTSESETWNPWNTGEPCEQENG